MSPKRRNAWRQPCGRSLNLPTIPSMGAWGAGPFENDAAMDYVGGLIDHMMGAVKEFMSSPSIDDGFDEAFAAIALLNRVMSSSKSRAHDADGQLDAKPIREAMLRCFDEQIDEFDPDSDYKRDLRPCRCSGDDRGGHVPHDSQTERIVAKRPFSRFARCFSDSARSV